jgi:hypothetical protein
MIERIEVKRTQSRGNLYHVPVKQWNKWSPAARQVFNDVHSSMSRNQHFFIHPKQEKASRSHWKTTAWNAAWTAASAADEAYG